MINLCFDLFSLSLDGEPETPLFLLEDSGLDSTGSSELVFCGEALVPFALGVISCLFTIVAANFLSDLTYEIYNNNASMYNSHANL